MAFIVPKRKNGPKAHLPVALLIDKSASAEDIRPILNTCVEKLIKTLRQDTALRGIVELYVAFFSNTYEVVADFEPIETIRLEQLYLSDCHGFTETGRALLEVLQRLDEKKIEWKRKSEKYYQPLVFLLTDGYPDAGKGAPIEMVKRVRQDYQMAAQQIRAREKAEKIVFLAAGIEQVNGVSADMAKLRELTIYPERIVKVCESNEICKIERFFNLIYESTNATFNNTPVGEIIREVLLI